MVMHHNPYARLKPPIRRPYTEIYLIRHCHPDYDQEKTVGEYFMPLSAAGKKQRRYLTPKLLKLGIERAYSSGLPRAQETAAPFLEKSGLPLRVEQRLDEIDWQNWHRIKYFNMSETRRVTKFRFHDELDRRLDKMQAAARRTLAAIWRDNKGKRVALFTHGNFIKSLLTGIINADVIGFLSLEIFQSSLTKLVIDRDGYIKINYINDASHLPNPPAEDLFITLTD